MEDLVIKDEGEYTTMTIDGTLYNDGLLYIETEEYDGPYVTIGLTPSQTRELIAHLTNCLKEVENG